MWGSMGMNDVRREASVVRINRDPSSSSVNFSSSVSDDASKN